MKKNILKEKHLAGFNPAALEFNPEPSSVFGASPFRHGLEIILTYLFERLRMLKPNKKAFLELFLLVLMIPLMNGFFFSQCVRADDGLPGFQQVEAMPVPPSEAREILEGLQSRTLTAERAGGLRFGTLAATDSTDAIEAMARALKYDVDLIYEYVHDKITYTPIFGSLKGADATLTDGIGNDFDQASLMISLLRASGYTANYKYGRLKLYPAELTSWLGVDDDPYTVSSLLGSAGIPATPYVDANYNLLYAIVSHVWVEVDIEGTNYVFDPSFKTHTVKEAIDLEAAMGYNQSTFLSNALSGATQGTDYIQNVNKTNLSSDLAAYAGNLIQEIRTNHPGAALSDIVGGLEIVPAGSSPIRQTEISYQNSVTDTWTEIPASYRTTLRIQHGGIDETFYSDEIYGKRLTIFYNTSDQPVMRLDGNTIETGAAQTPGASVNITLAVNHPYAANSGTYCDQTRTFSLTAGGSYTVVNGWAETARGMVEKHRKILKENKAAEVSDTDEKVMGETLTMMGNAWLAECHMSDRLMDAMFRTIVIHHHTLGLCGQNQSPYIDMPMGFVSTVSKENDTNAKTAAFFASSGRSSALEWGIMEQFQPHSAVCTVKLLDIANSESDKIFDVTSANWSTVQSQLTGYSSGELSNVSAYVNAGYRVILPQNGDLAQGDWKGVGFLVVSSDGSAIGHIISGGLSGGFVDTPFTADPIVLATTSILGDDFSNHDLSFEPIDLVTGNYIYDHTDLALGSGAQPFSIAFGRSYNSANRLTDGSLGLGWTHGFDINATTDDDGFLGMGERSPIEAAAVIAEIYATTDLLFGDKTNANLVVASMGHRWYMDRLIKNVVNIDIPGNTRRFVKLADGSFSAPPGDGSTLTMEADDSYLMKTKHGVELDFDTDGNLSTWKDANDNTLNFSYASGALQSVSNGMSRTFTLTYNGDHITQLSDSAGRSVSYAYDGDGNLVQVTDAEGNATVFEYDLPGRMTGIYYPTRPSDPFVTNTYDIMDKIITQEDANGNAWHYYISGYRTEEVNPLGDGTVAYYDPNGKAIRRIDPLGNETTLEYDGEERLIKETYPEGNYASYLYDNLHNPVTVTLTPKSGSGQSPLTTQFTYDSVFSKLLTSTDPMGRTTTFTYDADGNLLRIDQPQVEGVTPVSEFTYNNRGQLLTKTDAEDRVTRYTYDGATGDLLSKIVDEGELNLTTQFGYDAAGNITFMTDPEGHTTSYAYNDLRLLTQETGPGPFNYVTRYDYDEEGRLVETRQETGDAGNPWQTTSIAYTYTGKTQTVTDPEGHVATYEYDVVDRLWKETNAENQTTEYIYDADGRLYQVVDADLEVSQEIVYTPNGLKESLADGNDNVTEYIYDGFDRLMRTTFPDASYETYGYDDAGNMIQKQTRAGEVIGYAYDALNRLADKTLPGSQTTTFTYDLTGLTLTIADVNGTFLHQYDNAMRLSSVQYPDGKSVGYQYDDNSNRTRLTYPDGSYVGYQYDEIGRLTDIRLNGSAQLAHYDYDALSRRVLLTYGNGTSTSYAYQIDNDLSAMTHQHGAGTVTFDYVTNAIGLRTRMDIDDYRFEYRPGVVGNTSYSPNSLNQYATVGGISYSYDANGNLISDGVNGYTYNAENRLLSADTPEHNASYVYDPMGRRVEKDVDGEVTRYLHDGRQVIVEYDGSDTELKRYIYGPGIDEPICMTVGANTYYYQFDGLGSVVALSDEEGNYQEIYSYSVFGEPNGTGLLGNPYLYTGRSYDAETGLYYYRARYYNPVIGRFVQIDPIGYSDGMNLYSYVQNDPVNLIDPLGLAWYDNWHYEGRDARNSNLPSSPDEAATAGGTLLPHAMSKYHDDPKTQGPEKKYIFDSGQEAVYYSDTGQLVTDPRYRGTYNYVNPAELSWNPLKWQNIASRGAGHFVFDMLPYYVWGNERPTENNSGPYK